jgi:hypothetical protein
MEIAKIELDGLPQEVLDQLSKKHNPKRHAHVRRYMAAAEAAGGPFTADYVLVHLYREHGKIYKRNVVQQALARLSRRGLLQRLSVGVFAKQ